MHQYKPAKNLLYKGPFFISSSPTYLISSAGMQPSSSLLNALNSWWNKTVEKELDSFQTKPLNKVWQLLPKGLFVPSLQIPHALFIPHNEAKLLENIENTWKDPEHLEVDVSWTVL